MQGAYSVTVSVSPLSARRRAYWAEDGRRLVLEPLQPLGYTKKTLQPLEAFRRLWRALDGGAVDGFARFREAVPLVAFRGGCLAPHLALPEAPCVAGLIEVEPTRLLDTFHGWLEATILIHLWVEALGADGPPIVSFVEGWLRSTHQHLGLQGETWQTHFPLLFSLGDEYLSLPLDSPMNAAARLVALHRGRRLLSSRLIRQHLHTEGLRGLLIPPAYPSLVYNGPVVAETGLYHLALLRLGRSSGLRACEVCGTLFQPKRSTAKYCSARCRTAAYRVGG